MNANQDDKNAVKGKPANRAPRPIENFARSKTALNCDDHESQVHQHENKHQRCAGPLQKPKYLTCTLHGCLPTNRFSPAMLEVGASSFGHLLEQLV